MLASFKRAQSGFTILELLVVIIFIGILGFVVFNTYGDVQSQKRNQERRGDIESLHGQLEIYHAQNDIYPLPSHMTDVQWVNDNLPGLETRALADPLSNELFTIGTEPGEQIYAYEGRNCRQPDEENGEEATQEDAAETLSGCQSYTLTATFEGEENGETTYVKQSLEGQSQEESETN